MPGERGVCRTVNEKTVIVNIVENKSVSATSVIKSIEELVGAGDILDCVPKSWNLYGVTLNENDSIDLIWDTGLKIRDINFKPNAIFFYRKTSQLFESVISCSSYGKQVGYFLGYPHIPY